MNPHELACEHEYEEISFLHDDDGETYKCKKCGHRYRLHYDDMKVKG
jgi:hypothetical protein